MAVAFAEGRRVLYRRRDRVGCIRTQDYRRVGSAIEGMIKGGWTITGSWPISPKRPGAFARRNLRHLPQAFISSADRVREMRTSAIGQGCWASFPIESVNGWSAFR